MTEDFIIEEEGTSATNRRPFLIAVGILLTILILAMICSATLLLRRGGQNGNGDAVAAIETKNAEVLAANAAVTQTIAARETEDARPTNTPVAPATNTPRPTSTPQPTNTPVVAQAGDDEPTTTPDVPGTATAVAAGETEDNTPTPIAALGGGDGTLPQTGIETWGALVAAFVLMTVFLVARRLRSR